MPVGEKRKHTRVRIQSMDVKCAVRFDTEVSLLNISQSGACISLTKPLVMGKEYALHIETEGKTHSINGIVIWERIAGSEKNVKSEILPCYEVGLSFKGTHVEDFSNYRIIRISESGMGIETDQTFDPDNKFRMELMLPGEKRPVQFVGRVASCLKISERIPVSFDTGIEFLEMSTEDQSLLKKFITSIRKF
jgi:hypothetical protein